MAVSSSGDQDQHRGQRWPRRVYGVGKEPDPRFTFANERTFLAWIRTSLALLAAGVALHAFVEDVPTGVRTATALLLVAIGIASAVLAFVRWTASERAMRLGQPLPGAGVIPLLAYAVAAVGLLGATLMLIGE